MKSVLKVYGAKETLRVLSTTPVSPLKNISASNIGCLIVPMEIESTILTTDSCFDIAREYKKKLSAALSSLYHFPHHFSATPFMQKLISTNVTQKASGFKYCCQISNLGIIDDLFQSDRYTVENFFFLTSRNHADVLMSLYLATLNNKIFLAFAYPHPLLSEESALKVIGDFNKVCFDLAE